MNTFIRTKRDGVFRPRTSNCGTVYVPCDDPDATHDDPPSGFTLNESFPRLDVPNWQRIISLFYAYLDKGREVSVILLRDEATSKRWRVMVPKQETDTTTCKCDLTVLRDLETGEDSQGIPDGWYHAGSSHSHHTMGAYPSATDDSSELGVPGLHVIVGKMNSKTYSPYTSVVQQKTRYKVECDSVIDSTARSGFKHHPSVMEMVTERTYTYVSTVKDDDLWLNGRRLSEYGKGKKETKPAFYTEADSNEKEAIRQALLIVNGLSWTGQMVFRRALFGLEMGS